MISMYKLDDHLIPWIEEFSKFEANLEGGDNDHEINAFKIMYEASTELYLSIVQPQTTRTVKAILTRSLIESYADVFSVFRHDDPAKQAKKYVKYAHKLSKFFSQQSLNYTTARDQGKVTTRPFALDNAYKAFWNGRNITTRIENIDGGRHLIAFYEFFSLFAHVNPSRQHYLQHFEDNAVSRYHSYIMLITLQTFVSRDFAPEKYFVSLNQIAAEYAADYIKSDTTPKYPE